MNENKKTAALWSDEARDEFVRRTDEIVALLLEQKEFLVARQREENVDIDRFSEKIEEAAFAFSDAQEEYVGKESPLLIVPLDEDDWMTNDTEDNEQYIEPSAFKYISVLGIQNYRVRNIKKLEAVAQEIFRNDYPGGVSKDGDDKVDVESPLGPGFAVYTLRHDAGATEQLEMAGLQAVGMSEVVVGIDGETSVLTADVVASLLTSLTSTTPGVEMLHRLDA